MEKEHDYLFKVILVGDSGVGKTSLMKRYTDDTYIPGGASTIGVDFKFKTLEMDKKKVKLQIWDTAGQERFRAIVAHYYRGANGILLVFDLCNRDSFDHLKDWMDELAKRNVDEKTDIKILGNKSDEKDKIKVTGEDIKKFLSEYKIPESNYYEVSAKTGQLVEDSFRNLTKKMIEVFGKSGMKLNEKTRLKMNDTPKSGCC
jgi:Ras-related protein Rab-1A